MFNVQFKKDKFLTKNLNINSFNLIKASKKINLNRKKNVFITFKVNQNNLNINNVKINSKFLKFIDAEHQYKGKLKKTNNSNNCEIAKKTDMKNIINIAENSLNLNRFSLDNRIQKKCVKKIKRNWVKNFFKKKRGDYMIIRKLGKKVIIDKDLKILILDI